MEKIKNAIKQTTSLEKEAFRKVYLTLVVVAIILMIADSYFKLSLYNLIWILPIIFCFIIYLVMEKTNKH